MNVWLSVSITSLILNFSKYSSGFYNNLTGLILCELEIKLNTRSFFSDFNLLFFLFFFIARLVHSHFLHFLDFLVAEASVGFRISFILCNYTALKAIRFNPDALGIFYNQLQRTVTSEYISAVG